MMKLTLELLEDRILPSTGTILREYWSNIPGTNVSDLTSNPAYPSNPTGASFLTSFDGPHGFGTNYGSRIRGTVTAPQTGTYTFWIASDDSSQLFLSNDATPANEQLIASVDGYTGYHEWTKYPTQMSAPLSLVAGQSYAIEALHEQGGGDDHVSVAWTRPDGTFEIIPGAQLSPLQATVQLWCVDNNANRLGHDATFTVTRNDDFGRDLTVRYTLSGAAVNGVDFASLPGTVTIPRGQSSATIVIHALPGGGIDKTTTLTLQPGPDYQLSVPSTTRATATIVGGIHLPTGTALLPANWLDAVSYHDATYGSYRRVTVGGPGFNEAGQVTVTTVPPNSWSAQALVKNSAAIQAGDNVLISAWVRNVDPTWTQGTF
jgi:hypothetical protein